MLKHTVLWGFVIQLRASVQKEPIFVVIEETPTGLNGHLKDSCIDDTMFFLASNIGFCSAPGVNSVAAVLLLRQRND